MSTTVRSINIKGDDFNFSLKFSKENNGILISVPGFTETLQDGVTHFSEEFKEHLKLKQSAITKLENFIIECVETNNPTIMFELNMNTGYIKKMSSAYKY